MKGLQGCFKEKKKGKEKDVSSSFSQIQSLEDFGYAFYPIQVKIHIVI